MKMFGQSGRPPRSKASLPVALGEKRPPGAIPPFGSEARHHAGTGSGPERDI